MAFVITDASVSCGSCADQCPVEAISEGEGKYVIDADVCVSCGSCADQCPTEAIEEGYLVLFLHKLLIGLRSCAGQFFIV